MDECDSWVYDKSYDIHTGCQDPIHKSDASYCFRRKKCYPESSVISSDPVATYLRYRIYKLGNLRWKQRQQHFSFSSSYNFFIPIKVYNLQCFCSQKHYYHKTSIVDHNSMRKEFLISVAGYEYYPS